MNYREYARTADYSGAAKLIERVASRLPQASEDWKSRVLADTAKGIGVKKNVGGITRAKGNIGGITRVKGGDAK